MFTDGIAIKALERNWNSVFPFVLRFKPDFIRGQPDQVNALGESDRKTIVYRFDFFRSRKVVPKEIVKRAARVAWGGRPAFCPKQVMKCLNRLVTCARCDKWNPLPSP